MECPEGVPTARCWRCKQKEIERRRSRYSNLGLSTYQSLVHRQRAEYAALEDAPERAVPRSLAEYADAAAYSDDALVSAARGLVAQFKAQNNTPFAREGEEHAHHWVIGPTRGGVEPAICRLCGEQREFRQSDEAKRNKDGRVPIHMPGSRYGARGD